MDSGDCFFILDDIQPDANNQVHLEENGELIFVNDVQYKIDESPELEDHLELVPKELQHSCSVYKWTSKVQTVGR